jgi:hypothetical protein
VLVAYNRTAALGVRRTRRRAHLRTEEFSMPDPNARRGRGRLFDGKVTIVGEASVIGRNVHIQGHEEGSGKPVDRSYVNRGVVLDWLPDEGSESWEAS